MALAIQFPLAAPVALPPVVTPAERPSSADPLATLRSALAPEMLRELQTGRDLRRDQDRRLTTLRSSALAPLDTLLGGGLRRGTMTELTGWRSSGRFASVLAILASVTSTGEAAALIDAGDGLDPESAHAIGIDLDRLLWIRPERMRDAVHCAELVIQTGFPLVVVDLGIRLSGRRPYEAAWVRLSRAAEHHGTVLVLSSPWPMAGGSSEAVITFDRPRGMWQGGGKTPSLLKGIETTLRLDRHRHRRAGEERKWQWKR